MDWGKKRSKVLMSLVANQGSSARSLVATASKKYLALILSERHDNDWD
jgi:hypothetical protein